MKTIKVKSWICDCGYSQEFDAFDPENIRIHFHEDRSENYAAVRRRAGYDYLRPGQCPNCGALDGMREAFPHETRTVMNITEESDLILLRQELEAAPPRKVSTGLVEIRQETEEERTKRIDAALNGHPEQLRASIQGELEKTPLLTREFSVFRDETPEEKAYRIDKEMSERRAATPEEIEALCQQYECK